MEPQLISADDRAVALYHVVYAHESFEEVAHALFELVRISQNQQPGKPRKLFLDIDGHRNEQGGFDADMFELQQNFLPQVLSRYLSEIHSPLGQIKNRKPQDDNLPPELRIGGGDPK